MSTAATSSSHRIGGKFSERQGGEFSTDGVNADNTVLAELQSALFGSLARSDQRRKGAQYLRGLLGVSGRKSIRNIASMLGGSGTEQSLQHFINDSTWDWEPVSKALTNYVMEIAPPRAWVVRPMVVPKAGEQCVGVEKSFIPAFGRVVNAQQSMGVWAAADDVSYPVSWRLRLSQSWLADERRQRSSIPDDVLAESLHECTVEAFLGMTNRLELPERPVVLDARDVDASLAIDRFSAAKIPLLARVCHMTRFTVTDRGLSGHIGESLPTHQIAVAAQSKRIPALPSAHDRSRNGTLAATVRVRTPSQAAGTDDLLLLVTGEIGHMWPGEVWLTNMTDGQIPSLVRLAQLADQVDSDFDEIADHVGIRDYVGRSYAGWHRHMTLASAAHAVVAQSRCPVSHIA